MTDPNSRSPILNYATATTDRVHVPFWLGRRLGRISALAAFSPAPAAFIVHPLVQIPHATFYCCGGLLAIGLFVGILGVVLDSRKDAALLAILLNAFLFSALTFVYPGTFDGH